MTKINTQHESFGDLNDILQKYLGGYKLSGIYEKVFNLSVEEPQKKRRSHSTQPSDFLEENFSNSALRTQLDHIVTFAEKLLSKKKYLKLLLELGRLSTQQGELRLASDIYSLILYKTVNRKEYSEEKGYAYLGLSRVYSYQAHWRESLSLSRQAKNLFKKNKLQKGLVESENLIGSLYAERGELKNAIQHFNEALKLLKRKPDRLLSGMVETNLGIYNNITANFNEAEKYYNKALKKFKGLKNTKRISESYHNIGMLYLKKGDFKKALKNLGESIDYSIQARYLPTLAISYLAKAHCYTIMDDIKSATDYLQKSLDISNQINDRLTIADIYKVKGIIQRKLKNYTDAEAHFTTSLRINDELNNKLNYAETSFELGLLHQEIKKKKSAQKYFKEALKYFQKIGAVKDVEIVESQPALS